MPVDLDTPLPIDAKGPDCELTDRVADALHGCFPDRYWSHENRLVRRQDDRMVRVTVPELSPQVARAATLVEVLKDGTVRNRPVPTRIQRDLLYSADAHCRPLEGITRAPFLAPNGDLVVTPGYHPPTQLWLSWEGAPITPVSPTTPDGADVLERLLDFPFVDTADRTHALGLFLVLLQRPAISGPVPLHLIASTAPGTGKTTLGRAAGLVAFGEEPILYGLDGWRGEQGRQLHTYLQDAPPLMLLDNLPTGAVLGGSDLHRILTSPGRVAVRIVRSGRTTMLKVRSVFAATANHPALDVDMQRRTVTIRLAEVKHRAYRTPDLAGWLRSHRRQVLAVLLGLIQDWLDAGRPAPAASLKGFDVWSQVVGGVLSHGGFEGFLGHGPPPPSPLDQDFAELLSSWPADPDGRPRPLRPGQVLGVAEQLALTALLDRVAGGCRASRMGRILHRRATERWVCNGQVIVRGSQRGGADYRPQPYGMEGSSSGR